VWNISDRQARSKLQGFHSRGVVLLEFNNEGNLLASVGQDDENSIAIYEWATGTLRGSAKGGRDKILAISFVPGSTDFVTAGNKHVKFWSRQGLNLACKAVSLGELNTLAFSTIAWLGPLALIGTSVGGLVLLNTEAKKLEAVGGGKKGKGAEPKTLLPAHDKGAVFAAATLNGGSGVVTGGKDGRIIFWSAGEEGQPRPSLVIRLLSAGEEGADDAKATTVSYPEEVVVRDFRPMDKAIRSVDVAPLGQGAQKVLVGTLSAEILELYIDSKGQVSVPGGMPLVAGHFKVGLRAYGHASCPARCDA
jgi:hypothetical protein